MVSRVLVLLILLAVVVVGAVRLRENGPLRVSFDPARLGADLDAQLARDEGLLPHLRPGTAKGIVWADPATRGRTPLAIVYLHGFSASRLELSPVPERVAAGLGANLFLTRLTGHGQDGAAMGDATAAAWIDDVAEALAIGRRLGERVVVIGTSTGGTLATLAAADPDLLGPIAGVVLVSPNFGPLGRGVWLLDMPLARWWLPLLLGSERGFEPVNDAHAAGWTVRYPVRALLPMAEIVRRARGLRFEEIAVPALFVFSPGDTVVDPTRTAAVAARWGGPAQVERVALAPGDDPRGHVLAGDALGPGHTDAVVALILDWVRGLEGAPHP